MERAGTAPAGSGRCRRIGALIGLMMLPVAACGRAVTVDPPPGAPLECQAIATQLPQSLRGQPRLSVTPDNGSTAAWGSPAIVWRCGVTVPASLRRTSQLVTVNGVDWFPEQLSAGTRFTTVGPTPAVELSVPADYPNAAEFLTELPALRQAQGTG